MSLQSLSHSSSMASPEKHINCLNDLAINGAAPAFAEPLHVGRPNIGDRSKYLQLIGDMLERRWLSNNGPLVQQFEKRIAGHLGVKHVVAMCNGTVALEIAVRALGLTGEVILPSYTFIATAHAVYWQGLTPIFADIDPHTHCIDPASVRRLITPRTSGVIGVHLWGRPAPIEELQEIASKNNLKLMFDAAHAFGVEGSSSMIGNNADCEVFSFHATKFLNSLEGGAVCTNSDDLAQKMQLMRNFGFSGFDNVVHPGTNGKMVEACAAMGLVNLDSLDQIVEANRQNYIAYKAALSGVPHVSLLTYDETKKNNYQYIVVEIEPNSHASRDDLIVALTAENVLARRYFWPGCHYMAPYKELFPWADGHLPNTKRVADRVIVLPTGTSVGEADIQLISRIFAVMLAPR